MKQELINRALEYLNSVEAFASKEVPAYIQELLEFKFYEYLIEYSAPIFISGSLFITSLILLYFFYHLGKEIEFKGENDNDNAIAYFIAAGLSAMVTIGSFTALFVFTCQTDHIVSMIKVKTAPRVYLVDYFKDSIKK